MTLLQNMTIKHKMTYVTMLTCIVSLVSAGVAFIVWGQVTFKSNMVRGTSIQAAMVADNCKAALAFEDADDAKEILKAFHAEESVVFGAIFKPDGESFAMYQRDEISEGFDLSDMPQDNYKFGDGHLTVARSIMLDGEKIGTLCVRTDLTALHAMFERNVVIIFSVLVIASIVAYFVCSASQKIISEPILNLAKIAKGVSEEKDYSIRAMKHGHDEIGSLIDAFNAMLEQIQDRDSMLVGIKKELERRVNERTAELTVANEQLNKDIDERRQIEDNLNREKIFTESLINAMPGVFYLISDEGKLVRWNKNLQEVTGCSADEILEAGSMAGFFTESDRPLVSRKFKDVIEYGQAFVEANILATDGKEIAYFLVGVRVQIDEKAYIVGTGIDITERKKAERELEKTHKKLVEASRHAGMAEVATDVLHNVGNVLNSVNVATTLLTEKIVNSEVANLTKVTDMIQEHPDDLGTYLDNDPKGKHIGPYLIEVSKVLVEEQQDVTGRLKSLAENVEHIKEIVNMQQSYSKAAGVEVATTVEEMVENAVQINSAGLKRHGVTLAKELDDLGTIEIDKHKVLQIIVNLIGNAKYALDKSEDKEKIMTISCSKGNEGRFNIAVKDNGIGISEENLTQIFRHGFTTKKEGHGFGLHSGVLAAKEMGGSLSAHSEGVGQGAEFVLELPYKPVESVA